jgi:hypothetical protein
VKKIIVCALTVLLAFGCVERHADGAMNIRFQGKVLAPGGSPAGAMVYLTDRRLEEGSGVLICRATANGECAGVAAYGFSYDEQRWIWEPSAKAARGMTDRFALIVQADGYEETTQPLLISREQAEGLTPVLFSIAIKRR